MTFPVTQAREARLVECRFARRDDVMSLSGWARSVRSDDALSVQDTAEYADIAAEKWRYSHKQGRLGDSTDTIEYLLTRNATSEVAALLVVEATWLPSAKPLGFCYFRRSWSHNLLVDFLGTHPEVVRAEHPIRGVGVGLLFAVMWIGEKLQTGDLRGEATDQSAKFYQRQFRDYGIQDEFRLSAAEQSIFLEKIRAKWRSTGLDFEERRL